MVFYNTSPTEFYTLSLHDALPISVAEVGEHGVGAVLPGGAIDAGDRGAVDAVDGNGATEHASLVGADRSEEHTSELQSLTNLVCRLLLEKKKKTTSKIAYLTATIV